MSKSFFAKKPIGIKGQLDEVACLKYLAKCGSLTIDEHYEAAKSKRNPMHKNLEWDNTIAGDNWRKTQIRNIIHCVVQKTDAGDVRSFGSVVVSDIRKYVPLSDIRQSADLTQQLIKSILDDLNRIKFKLQAHENFFGPVLEAINRVEEKYQEKYEKESKGGQPARSPSRKKRHGVRNPANKNNGGYDNDRGRVPPAGQ